MYIAGTAINDDGQLTGKTADISRYFCEST